MEKFADETTIHGIAEWYRFRWIGRLLWGLLMVGCLVFLVLSVKNLVIAYHENHPVTSSDQVEFEYPPMGIEFDQNSVMSSYTQGQLDTIPDITPEELQYLKWHYFDSIPENMSFRLDHDRVTELLNLTAQKGRYLALPVFGDFEVEYTIVHEYQKSGIIVEPKGSAESPWKSIFLYVRCKGQTFFLLAGTWVRDVYTLAPWQPMPCGYIIMVTLSVTKHKRDLPFCNPELEQYGTDCFATCEANTRPANQCGPYIGSVVKGKGLTVCSDLDNSVDVSPSCVKRCKCARCHIPCQEFRASVSAVVDTNTLFDVNMSTSAVAVLFENDWSTKFIYTTKKVTFTELISSIGGTLCLCVGASFLSLLHLGYSIIQCGETKFRGVRPMEVSS